jgi:hypothetical protein
MSRRPALDLVAESLIARFATEQLQPWHRERYSFSVLESKLAGLSELHANLIVFDINNNSVSFRIKSQFEQLLREGHSLEVVRRAEVYCRLIQEALDIEPQRAPLVFAIQLGDESPQQTEVPTFTFQKRAGEVNILIPDFEIVSLGYLDAVPADTLTFHQKINRAAFAGSTTGGGLISLESLRSNSTPRIRAARFFKNVEAVDFALPNLVQLESAEVEAELRREGFGVNRMDWSDSYQRKFLISIDGNGAPCSRPALILRSNSALIKYASHHVLFYSTGMVPWEHYIPVYSDQEVCDVVEREMRQPGQFAHVAANGLQFSKRVFTRNGIIAYTNEILHRYARLIY